METKSNFTIKVVRDLLSHGFSVHLHQKEHIDGYGGWFGTDEDGQEFVVAMKHHMGFEILLHEYCHFLQWKHDRKLWEKSNETYDILFNWIADPALVFTDEQLDQSLHDILEIEHDCEKRALKIVKNAPIEDFDIDKYTKAVNAYLWSYHLNRELRKRPKNPIYSPKVLEYMPTTFHDLNHYLDKTNLDNIIRQGLITEYQTGDSNGSSKI